MRMYLISDNTDTLTGMRLAGIEGVVAHSHEEVKNALDTALSKKDIGILLLTEALGRQFPDLVRTVRAEHKMPLLIEIPDRHGTGRRPDFITSYVNEAIGLKL
ncbi:V-type ATP synthase subunit F [Lachnospiraceae bacterium 45-P1]